MRSWLRATMWAVTMAASPLSAAAAEGRLVVTANGLLPGGRLPPWAAFCPRAGMEHAPFDVSPAVRWRRGPAATRSYVLLMTDPDVPADLTLIDRPGVVIAADAPRQTIHHWVVADVPRSVHALPRGTGGDGLVPHGKPVGPTPFGVRGANGYTGFLHDVPAMAGTYGGYDGPCPPRNDARMHRYVKTVYALDVPRIGLSEPFGGTEVEAAMQGHVLARGAATAVYGRRGE